MTPMPSKPKQSPPEKNSGSVSKKIMTIIPLVIAVATSIGTVLYQLTESIRSNSRKLDKLQIKDYRQHRDILRYRVSNLADAVTSLESVLEDDPVAFGPGGKFVLKTRREDLIEARERLENYVEENKHYGSSD